MSKLSGIDLFEEYEEEQLVPVESEDDGNPSEDQIQDLIDDLPESAGLRLRIAIFESIIDEVIEDSIEESDDENIDSEAIEEIVEPIVDKMITVHMVPATVKKSIPKLIARHLKKRNPMISLLESTADACADALIEINEDGDTVVDGLYDDDIKTIDKIDVEEFEINDDDLTVTEELPEVLTASLKYLTASSINRRKSVAVVSKLISGKMLKDTLKQVKNQLPASFVRKYHI